jgi:hypothetical protein
MSSTSAATSGPDAGGVEQASKATHAASRLGS